MILDAYYLGVHNELGLWSRSNDLGFDKEPIEGIF